MKKILLLTFMLAGAAVVAVAAYPVNELEQLKTQLREANAAFEQAVQQHQAVVEAISRRIEALEAATGQTNPAPATTASPPATTASPTAPAPEPVSTPEAVSAPATVEAHQPWSPSQPITLARGGSSYLNLSFDALFAAGGSSSQDIESLEFGGHDPKQNGFTVQNLELTFDGAVDPYFRGQANLVTLIDTEGETVFEVEEAYLESLAFPWNLQLKAGQFYAPFGRINATHPHTWDFVDQPLVIGRFLGPDGLRNPGAQLSWLTPTPFYSELFLSVQDSHGETALNFRNDEGAEWIGGRPAADTSVRGPGDLIYSPRYAVSFDLADEHTVVLGASGAFGPNATGGETRIYGADLFYKWKSRHQHLGFPFVTWQTEFLHRDYRSAAYSGDPFNSPTPNHTLHDWGIYSQIAYGFYPRWVASLRGDFVTGAPGDFAENPLANDRARVSPALTFYPSEFSKVRLQYNYDDIDQTGIEHSIWLQMEFLLGAHAAHKF